MVSLRAFAEKRIKTSARDLPARRLSERPRPIPEANAEPLLVAPSRLLQLPATCWQIHPIEIATSQQKALDVAQARFHVVERVDQLILKEKTITL
jgi:hypothetical protein